MYNCADTNGSLIKIIAFSELQKYLNISKKKYAISVLYLRETICIYIHMKISGQISSRVTRVRCLLAYVNKAKFWVDSWHPYLFISKNFTDQEKNGCQFFH